MKLQYYKSVLGRWHYHTLDEESLLMHLSVLTKRINITDETFLRWRKLRTEYNLLTDNMLACHLLDSVTPQELDVSHTQ